MFADRNLEDQRHLIDAAQDQHMELIVGPEVLPHTLMPDYDTANSDSLTPGLTRVFLRQAVKCGIENYFLRGNDPYRVHLYEEALQEDGLIEGTLFLPRIVEPAASITDIRTQYNNSAVAVIGHAICRAANIRQAALDLSIAFCGAHAAEH